MNQGTCVSFVVAGLLAAPPALAHTENSEGFSTLRVEGGAVSWELHLDYLELGRVVHLAPRGAPAAVQRQRLEESRGELGEHLSSRLRVSVDGAPCPGEVRSTEVERRLDRDYARIGLAFSCPGRAGGRMVLRYDLLLDDSDPSHRNLVAWEAEGKQGQFVFTGVQRQLTLGEVSALAQAARFAELGVHHILGGLDHVLFVVALLLGAASLATLLRVLTAFTVAHSITLALSLLGLVSFPSRVIEPLIALSIAWVSLAALFDTGARFRFPVVFGFGLVHGMGFAGALQLTGLHGAGLALPLVSFNVGIELGQCLVVLAVFPLLRWVRRFEWSRLAHGVGHGAISAVGLAWYAQRLFS